MAERLDDLRPGALQAALGQVVAEEVDRGDQRLRLQRQQPRRAGEVVAVGLGVDLDLVAQDLRVEDVGAAAEVDDVEQLDVLLQLLGGQLQPLAQVGGLQPLALLGGLDQHAGERHQAGEALGADRRLAAPVGAAARRLAQRALDDLGRLEAVLVAVVEEGEPALRLLAQLLGRQHLRVLAPAQDPGDQLARRGVLGLEDDALARRAVGLSRRAQLAVGAEVPLDQPGDAVADEDLGRASQLPQLPVGALAVVAAVEVLGRGEVVLGLGRVADLALDAGEAEDAHRVALVRVADQIELAAAEDEVEGVDLALRGLVALHRVVGELDRLAAGDRGLDLGEALGEVAAAGGSGHRHLDRGAVGLGDRVRVPPGDLLQSEAQRLGVGEAAVGQQGERGGERRQLVVVELDRVEVEVLRRQRVQLGLEEALARASPPRAGCRGSPAPRGRRRSGARRRRRSCRCSPRPRA